MWTSKIFGFEFYFLFYNFFLYSFLGWIYESTFVSIKKRTFVNRGFLNGPMIPIYGAGASTVYLFLHNRMDNAVFVFVQGMLLATVLEYITSFLMEKIFHAKWWDYSNSKYNIQGRVCLMASLFWGFLSILMSEVLQPSINHVIDRIPRVQGENIGYGILLLFVADTTVTAIYALQLDKKITQMQKLREEFAENIANSKLFEKREDIRLLLENSQISEWMGTFSDYKDEIEVRFKGFIAKYQKDTEKHSFIQKRLLKAFPGIKVNYGEYALKDLKDKLFTKK
jgi:Predicted membrane protein